MSKKLTFYLLLTGIIVIACLLHLFWYSKGFYSISWDESGRTISAHKWMLDKSLLKPTFWLPFYGIVVGLGLEIWPDLFITPRIISFIFGIVALLALSWLSYELFKSKRVTVLTAFLGTFFAHRIVLSLVPLSSIMFICIILISMAFFTRWLFSNSTYALIMSAVFFAISGTIRYEGWLFSAIFLLVVLKSSFPGKTRIKKCIVTIIVFAFPLLWMLLHGILNGSPLGFIQATKFSYTYSDFSSLKMLLGKNPFKEFIIHNALSLNLLGIISLIYLSKRNLHFKKWILVYCLPLLLMSIISVVGKITQAGPSWRMIGVWSILLIPFTAHFILHQKKPVYVFGLMLLVLSTFTLHTYKIKKDSHWAFPADEKAAGQYLNELLSIHPDSKILIQSDYYRHLNILIASQNPRVFLWNSYSLANGWTPSYINSKGICDKQVLISKKIKFLVFEDRRYKDILDSDAEIVKLKDFGNWSVYAIVT